MKYAAVLAWLAAVSCGGAIHPVASRCGSDATISSQADVRALASCTSVRSLHIASAAPLDLAALSSLQYVGGELAVGPTVGLEALTLPGLLDVGALHIISNSSLRSVSLSALTHAQSITIEREPALEMFAAPLLAHIDGDLRLDRVTSLSTLGLDQLASIGGTFSITGTTAFEVVALTALQRVGTVVIDEKTLPAGVAVRIAQWRGQTPAP